MRKAERLFQILTYLRGRRLAVTARQIAEHLEVSERTVYRDIQALIVSGVPIDSEAGVGYRLKRGFDLPPLMFSEEEVQALLLGMRMVQGWSDDQLGQAASQVIDKLQAVLPEPLQQELEQHYLMVPSWHSNDEINGFKQEIREAIKERRTLFLHYRREDGVASERQVEPLGLAYWGRVWTMVAWCRLRDTYRSFRIDRIQLLASGGETFTLSDEKNIQHFLSQVENKC